MWRLYSFRDAFGDSAHQMYDHVSVVPYPSLLEEREMRKCGNEEMTPGLPCSVSPGTDYYSSACRLSFR